MYFCASISMDLCTHVYLYLHVFVYFLIIYINTRFFVLCVNGYMCSCLRTYPCVSVFVFYLFAHLLVCVLWGWMYTCTGACEFVCMCFCPCLLFLVKHKCVHISMRKF